MKLVVHRFQWFIPVPSTRTTGYHHQTIPKGHTISRVHGFPQPISIGLNFTRRRIDSVAITERGVKQTGDGGRETGSSIIMVGFHPENTRINNNHHHHPFSKQH